MEILTDVLSKYGIDAANAEIKSFGTGLINHTWKIKDGDEHYILQRINENVFTNPQAIGSNIAAIGAYLQDHFPDYYFVAPVKTTAGKEMVQMDGAVNGCYRLLPFVNDSHSKDVVANADQAFEAAAQFGRFTKLLSGFDADSLQITLPSFHDLSYRYQQFTDALENGNKQRIEESASLIAYIKENESIVSEFESIQKNPSFKKRVTHHDTKISNVLFDSSDKAICVIDLDTIMPGYFISDVGDMMRTYLPTVSEEEKDFSKIEVRDDVYKAIVIGYYAEMEDELSPEEARHFFYAGKFMIYMQALRFLTDHINDDTYYGAKYPNHNLVRAGNQVTLLQRLVEKASVLNMQ
ncbi:MAG: aminoglycoside phosphotransferase family protein [Sediminibacterium sp.]|nr:aminoglycoside phosphotransferase family protein [Sediminibacterium sp.]